ERARDADEDHREGHRGTGVQRGHLPGDHEDPGADDGADAERDEIEGPERPRQGVLTGRLRLGPEGGDRLDGEEAHPAIKPIATLRAEAEATGVHALTRSEEDTSELQLRGHFVCRL